jgi:PKD repeat protein
VVTVNDLGPTAAFTWMPEPQDEGSAVQFTDGSTSYPDAIVGWAWDFGDGGVSSDQNPAHTYADNGIYTVTLTVTDDDGSTDIATHTVTVQNVSPSVDAGADVTINEGDTFSSAGSFTDPGADSWTATVDYGDGSGSQPLALSGKTFGLAHVYDDNGAYTVTVTVTDDDGGVGSDTAVVTVLNVAPTADAGADKAEYWGLSIAFSGSATDPSQADTAAGLNPEWAFGDGGTASGYDVSHIYANPGAYTATLTVTDKDGGSDTDDAAVTVKKRATGIAYTGDTAAIFGYAATLKAQLSDSVEAASALLAGRSVTFTINGVVIAATTDASGVAQATAPSLLMPGTYAVAVAFAGDSHYLGSSATGTLTVGNSVGKVTGGSMKFGAKGRGGFNVQSDGLTVKGELQYQDNSTNFHAPQLTALGIAPDRKSAWFAGVGRDGRSFVAYVEDNGEPGSKDVFKLWINGVAYNGDGVISGGNIQIHK